MEEVKKSRGSAALRLSYVPDGKPGAADWEEWIRVLLSRDILDTVFSTDWLIAIYPDLPADLGKWDMVIKT
eukprot:7469555-Ditylum_brightwellii.AAC.2